MKVYVAVGLYEVNYREGHNILVKESVSLYGGRTVDGTATGIISDTENGTKIYNNIIFGGKPSGSGDSFGIICNSGAAAVYNNTIAGGESDWSAAISLQNESTPIIENNILFSVAVSGGYCIYESTSNNGNAQSIHNNDFHDIVGNTIFYHTFGEADIDTLGDIDLLGYAGGNWDADPLLIDPDGTDNDFSTMNDNDWHLKADSPAEVRQGGLDGSLPGWGFETDFDGLTRTNLAAGPDNDPANDNAGGWSMGACEKDN